MRNLKIKHAINKTGDTGDDYVLELYKDDVYNPIKLNAEIDYKVKIGNDIGYLKTISTTISEDQTGLILLAKDLADFPDGNYYIEVWFEKDGLNYIYPSNGKARIKLDANIETVKGKLIPTITIDELRKEIAEKAVAGKDGDPGPQGPKGLDGKSAYQIWLDGGNTGTEQDFLNSLKGNGGDATDIEALKKMSIDLPAFDFDYSTLSQDGTTLESNTQTVDAQTISLSEDNGSYKFLLDENTFLGQLIQAAMPLLMARDNLLDIIKQMPAINKFISTDFWDKINEMVSKKDFTDLKAQVVELQKQVDELTK